MRHHPFREQAHRLHDLFVRQSAVIDFKRDLREAESFCQHCDFLGAFLEPADHRTRDFICSSVMLVKKTVVLSLNGQI
jgi:hypothetical protein